ncbi:hypothetical protein KIN20_010174, partial [Parelaphostrongylus tenuis]
MKTVRSLATSIRMALEAAYNGGEGVITNMNRLIVLDKFMWKIYVDLVILQYGGNVVDAVFIAHLSFIHCDRSTGPNFFRLEAAHAPLAVTVNQIGNSIAVDCTTAEEAAVRTALWVVMDQSENEDLSVSDLVGHLTSFGVAAVITNFANQNSLELHDLRVIRLYIFLPTFYHTTRLYLLQDGDVGR